MLFIFSQVFAVINYLFIALSYIVKNRKSLLIFSFLSLIANGVSYVLLSAWSGLAMVGVAILRNIIFMAQNKKENDKNISAADWVILAVLVIISGVSAVFTYDGFLSLFSVFATLTYTVSVWQKNITVYNVCGIFVSSLWIVYDLFVGSPFAIACETIMLIIVVCSLIVKKVKNSKENKIEDKQNFENLQSGQSVEEKLDEID